MPFLLSGPDIPLPVYLDARLQAGILAMPLPGNALSHHILQEPDDGDGNSTVRQQIPAKMSPFAISATHPLDFTNSITVTLEPAADLHPGVHPISWTLEIAAFT